MTTTDEHGAPTQQLAALRSQLDTLKRQVDDLGEALERRTLPTPRQGDESASAADAIQPRADNRPLTLGQGNTSHGNTTLTQLGVPQVGTAPVALEILADMKDSTALSATGSAFGLSGDANGGKQSVGVEGTSNHGTGVHGKSLFEGTGVLGESAGGQAGQFNSQSDGKAVGIENTGTGNGLDVGSFAENGYAIGAYGHAGIGLLAIGGRAQIRMAPNSTTGKPGGRHLPGELYMDALADLYICTAEGDPATWVKVSTTTT